MREKQQGPIGMPSLLPPTVKGKLRVSG